MLQIADTFRHSKYWHASSSFPFGGGKRSCPRCRFAEIQICATLTRISSSYTVELVPDEEDKKMLGMEGRDEKWLIEKTKEKAATVLYDGIGFTHGIYPERHVAVRFTKREKKE